MRKLLLDTADDTERNPPKLIRMDKYGNTRWGDPTVPPRTLAQQKEELLSGIEATIEQLQRHAQEFRAGAIPNDASAKKHHLELWSSMSELLSGVLEQFREFEEQENSPDGATN